MGKVRTDNAAKLTDFKLLSFDVYSTLIDEPGGMFTALLPLLNRLPNPSTYTSNRAATLQSFQSIEHTLQISHPTLPYNELLALAYTTYASSHSLTLSPTAASDFAAQIGAWPAFPDTVSALQTLKKHYKLVFLSNVDNASIARTISGPLEGVEIDAVYTAQDIGSYKPDLKNFEYLLKGVKGRFGVEKEEVLHTAQALRHDHVPAMKMGMTSCWIDRLGEKELLEEMRGSVEFTWRFESLGEMAEAVEKAFQDLKGE